MSALYETLVVEAGGPSARLLSPGAIQRALALGAGLKAEDLGAIVPLARGRVSVDVSAARAMTLSTPRPVPFRYDGSDAVLTLRRDDDPPGEELGEVTLGWSDGQGAPTPGQLAAAIAAAFDATLGAEDLGPAWVGDGWMRLTLPAALLLAGGLPETLTVGERALSFEHSGKKKP